MHSLIIAADDRGRMILGGGGELRLDALGGRHGVDRVPGAIHHGRCVWAGDAKRVKV